MSANSAIEWTDHTFNPWWGCSKVSPGCANCYAETFAHRFSVEWGRKAVRRPSSDNVWAQPLLWNKAAKKAGVRAKVFCGSMCDWADDNAPNGALTKLWALIQITTWLDWQMLTKRPENILQRLPPDWGNGYPNVLLGTTVENQDAASWRISILRSIPAATRFLSAEPLLGPLKLWETGALGGVRIKTTETGEPYEETIPPDIHWIIAGGESGNKARPMNPHWVRDIRDQCQEAGVPFLFKQWGEYAPVAQAAGPGDLFNFPDGSAVRRVGKRAAGRILDGREWNEFPQSKGYP